MTSQGVLKKLEIADYSISKVLKEQNSCDIHFRLCVVTEAGTLETQLHRACPAGVSRRGFLTRHSCNDGG